MGAGIRGHLYEVNTLFEVVVIFRIYSVVVFFIKTTRFYGLRVARVLDIYAVKT